MSEFWVGVAFGFFVGFVLCLIFASEKIALLEKDLKSAKEIIKQITEDKNEKY